jgi:hypothetical protein
MQRDVRAGAGIDRLDPLPGLLRALAQIAGQMCNYSQLGGQVGLDYETVARYPAIGSGRLLFVQGRADPRCTDSMLGQSQIAQAGYGSLWFWRFPCVKISSKNGTPLSSRGL